MSILFYLVIVYNITWGDNMLNDNIKYYRKKLGLTQVELAEKLNVSQSTITSWENGNRRPDLDFLPILAQLFGISVDELLGRESVSEQENIDTDSIRERYRRDPAYRLLFDAAENAKPEHLKAAAAMLKSLEGTENAD